MRRRQLLYPLGALALSAYTASPALAHPHIWVTTRAQIVFGGDGLVTAVRHVWTFDEASSAFQTLGLSPKDLQSLAKSSAEALAKEGYYTRLEANGTKQEFGAAREPRMIFEDGKLTLEFLMPLKTPTRADTITLEVSDPTFFTAFSMGEGADAVTLADVPNGCAPAVTPLKSDDQTPKSALVAAMTGTSAAPARSKVTLTCSEQTGGNGKGRGGETDVRDVRLDASRAAGDAGPTRLFRTGWDVLSKNVTTLLMALIAWSIVIVLVTPPLRRLARNRRGADTPR